MVEACESLEGQLGKNASCPSPDGVEEGQICVVRVPCKTGANSGNRTKRHHGQEIQLRDVIPRFHAEIKVLIIAGTRHKINMIRFRVSFLVAHRVVKLIRQAGYSHRSMYASPPARPPMSNPFPRYQSSISQVCLTVLDVTDSAIFLEVDVESLGLEVLGDHHSRLDDTALLRQILLAEALYYVVSRLAREMGGEIISPG